MPLIPLLVALAAHQRLVPTAEPAAKGAVHGLLVSTGGERACLLPEHTAAVPRAGLLVRWAFADGSLRFYRIRALGTALLSSSAPPVMLFARLHGGEVRDLP